MEIYGTIRNAGGVWTALDNVGHEPKNISAVSVVNGSSPNGYVEVFYPTCEKVGTFVATPDETCARAGILCGSSVGLGSAKIYFSQNGTPISPNSITNPAANIWVYGVMKMPAQPQTTPCPTCGGSGIDPA